MSPASRAAIGLVHAYRRWLSPLKGFSCPHAIATGGPTCSTYGLAVLRTLPLGEALDAIGERLGECRSAAENLARVDLDCGGLDCGGVDLSCDVPDCSAPKINANDACNLVSGCDSCDVFSLDRRRRKKAHKTG